MAYNVRDRLKKLAKGSRGRSSDTSTGPQRFSDSGGSADQMGNTAPPDEGHDINATGLVTSGRSPFYIGEDTDSDVATALEGSGVNYMEEGSWDRGHRTFTGSGDVVKVKTDGRTKSLTSVTGDISGSRGSEKFVPSLTASDRRV